MSDDAEVIELHIADSMQRDGQRVIAVLIGFAQELDLLPFAFLRFTPSPRQPGEIIAERDS